MIEISLKNPDTSIPLNSIREILKSALTAADPYALVLQNLELSGGSLRIGDKVFTLDPSSRIILVSLGKAAAAMASAAELVLKNRIDKGICVCKHIPEGCRSERIEIIDSSHPVPDDRSVKAAQKIKAIVQNLQKEDVVLLLLSGGGSALACLPANKVTLSDIQQVTNSLLRSGATINEMNVVRKHLDLFKGGGFLKMVQPAQVGVLVLSDVLGDPLDIIASGPAIMDISTYTEALTIVKRYIPTVEIPRGVLDELIAGAENESANLKEKIQKPELSAYHKVIASNRISVNAAADKAKALGYHTEVKSYELQGEAKDAWKTLMNHSQKRPFAVFAGGETTVTVHGNGLGGRNLEFALGAVEPLSKEKNVVLVTFSTDGEDGPTDAAGAVVSSGIELEIEYLHQCLQNNDSYRYFQNMGGLIKTGHTGTNVNDLAILVGF